MGRKMFSAHDVSMYLDGTVCIWKGSPVYVLSVVSGTDFVDVIHLSNKKKEKVDYTKDDFDYSSAPLGYVNYHGAVFYLERMPFRKTKQGIHYENTTCIRLDGRHAHIDDILTCASLAKTITGEYPSEQEAFSSLNNENVKSIAIDRHIAIEKAEQVYNLYYRNNKVASKNYNEVNFTLITSQHSSFMKKILARKVCIH